MVPGLAAVPALVGAGGGSGEGDDSDGGDCDCGDELLHWGFLLVAFKDEMPRPPRILRRKQALTMGSGGVSTTFEYARAIRGYGFGCAYSQSITRVPKSGVRLGECPLPRSVQSWTSMPFGQAP